MTHNVPHRHDLGSRVGARLSLLSRSGTSTASSRRERARRVSSRVLFQGPWPRAVQHWPLEVRFMAHK